MERKTTGPASIFANGLWNHFTGRKKYTIKCGECEHTWTDKVSFATDTASSLCPCCGAQNKWSHSQFERDYDRELRFRQASRRA
jgi:hypothetical protein